jgi:hypothetical protein
MMLSFSFLLRWTVIHEHEAAELKIHTNATVTVRYQDNTLV